MSEKAEALRLADALDARVVPRWVHSTGQTPQQSGYAADAECVQAAAELRRQHALIKEWEACAKACYDADKSTHPTDLGDAIRARSEK